MAWTNPVTVTVGQVLTASLWNTYIRDNSNWDHNLGTLARAETTTSQTGIVGGLITGLSVTPTVVAGRRIKITVYTSAFGSFSNTDGWVARIKEGAAQLQQGNPIMTAVAIGSLNMTWEGTPSAGAHTYTVEVVHTVGSTTATWYADTTYPSFIMVEDCAT